MKSLGIIVCATLVVSALPAFAQSDIAPGWITATNKPCKIWNPSPQPNESVTWSGQCKDGYASGEGALRWTEDGKPDAEFDGEYARGKRNGHGVMIMPDGDRTEGDWIDDRQIEPDDNGDAI